MLDRSNSRYALASTETCACAAAFATGDSDCTLNTIDTDGISLAAIQGLDLLLRAQSDRLALNREFNRELNARVEQLERLLARRLGDTSGR